MKFYKQQHEFYCGIDLHANSMHVCVVDQVGNKLRTDKHVQVNLLHESTRHRQPHVAHGATVGMVTPTQYKSRSDDRASSLVAVAVSRLVVDVVLLLRVGTRSYARSPLCGFLSVS